MHIIKLASASSFEEQLEQENTARAANSSNILEQKTQEIKTYHLVIRFARK
jgi:hypothetical protein